MLCGAGWDCVVVRCWCWAQESFKNECNSWVCLCSVWTRAGECHTEHWQRFPTSGHKTDQVSRSSLITRCEWVSAMWTLHRIVIITMHQPVAAHNARMGASGHHLAHTLQQGVVQWPRPATSAQFWAEDIALQCCVACRQENDQRSQWIRKSGYSANVEYVYLTQWLKSTKIYS